MHSPSSRKVSQACCHGCCPTPLCGLLEQETSTSITTAASFRYGFEDAMAFCFNPNSLFTNHESIPSLRESYTNFTRVFPQYYETERTDEIREQEYDHLSISKHVCLDYNGHGLFSYSQQKSHCQVAPIGMKTSFFDASYKVVDLNSQLQYGGQESKLEYKIRKRITAFMNLSEDDYNAVFTANQSSAFKLLAESFPFESNPNLLIVYDHKNEAVEVMIKTSKKKGARPMSAEFLWPSSEIHSEKLLKKLVRKRKNRKGGLFVFPLQSRMTGARYPYLWMSIAQEHGWHVLLDACALGPKEMETLGLSLFKPDFLICSFFKVFGENPSGFGCLFVKKSIASIFKDSGSSAATSIGIVRLVPPSGTSQQFVESAIENTETEGNTFTSQKFELYENQERKRKQKAPEIEEVVTPPESSQSKTIESSTNGDLELECRALDHADSLGLILITARARFLINWLVNALMRLQHPQSENGVRPVRIYGPKVKFNRGPAVAFNVFDWKGEKIDPELVQKLADRKNIFLSYGFLHHISFPNKYEEDRKQILETRASEEAGTTLVNKNRDVFGPGISVVTATVGLLTNFEDVYRLWEFVSRFLDADFVEKEKWRYTALNQQMIEI